MTDPAKSQDLTAEGTRSDRGSASSGVSEDSQTSQNKHQHVEFTPSTSGADDESERAEGEGGKAAGAAEQKAQPQPQHQHQHHHRHRQASHQVVCIGVDGSQNSDFSVEWYLDNVHKSGNEVVFMHSFELPMLHSYQDMYVAPEIWQGTLKREANRTSEMEKRLLGKLKERQIRGRFVACGGGKPGEAIVKTAESQDADVIVVGTRGQGKMLRTLMGSVSSYVMHHAHCPVLVCRPKEHDRKGRESKDGSIKKGKAGTPGNEKTKEKAH